MTWLSNVDQKIVVSDDEMPWISEKYEYIPLFVEFEKCEYIPLFEELQKHYCFNKKLQRKD